MSSGIQHATGWGAQITLLRLEGLEEFAFHSCLSLEAMGVDINDFLPCIISSENGDGRRGKIEVPFVISIST